MKSPSKLGWYARRLRGMSAAEIAWRLREQAVRRAWAHRQVRQSGLDSLPPLAAAAPAAARRFTSVLPPDAVARVPERAKAAIVADADRLINGEWEMLGALRTDMKRPDWFFDQVTGRRSAPGAYAFALDQRDEAAVGNVKQVWEVNRLQHLTLLATAWYLTEADAYAQRVADQLESWWRENPFLSGINWTSGIELGVRLINFAWIRRLLDGWPGAADLFEHNELAVRQIRWHQEYLAAFESRGSSANNHVIAEAAGQLAASCAFPWFPESGQWRRASARLLERELAHNTFPSGINRELASDYHGFVAELGFFAAIEAAAAGVPLSDATWRLLCAMTDCMAALVDERSRPPRQADSDEGRVVLLDAPEHNRCPRCSRLATRCSDASTGGRRSPQTRAARSPPPCSNGRAPIGKSRAGRQHGRPGSPMPAFPSSERKRLTPPRYGFAVTADRTASFPSPPTPTPTRCPSRCGGAGSTSSPTPARTAITASPSGGRTSSPRSRTTPPRSAGRTSQRTAARSYGRGTRRPASLTGRTRR